MSGLALASARLPFVLAVTAVVATGLASACSEEKAEPRYLEDSGFTPDTGTDARGDRYIPCDPTDSTCPDAASDASVDADSGDAGLCPATNGCNTAMDLGKVSGDNNADQLSATGSSSRWLSVRVTEDSSGVLGTDLTAKISLVSPTSANFDLFVYYDTMTDVVRCTPPTASSTQQAGISDTASVSIPDIGFSDDDRTVIIEVRYVSGACNPAEKWTLLVQGNLL